MAFRNLRTVKYSLSRNGCEWQSVCLSVSVTLARCFTDINFLQMLSIQNRSNPHETAKPSFRKTFSVSIPSSTSANPKRHPPTHFSPWYNNTNKKPTRCNNDSLL